MNPHHLTPYRRQLGSIKIKTWSQRFSRQFSSGTTYLASSNKGVNSLPSSSKFSVVYKVSKTDLIKLQVLQMGTKFGTPLSRNILSSVPTFSHIFKSNFPNVGNQSQCFSIVWKSSKSLCSLVFAPPALRSCPNRQIYKDYSFLQLHYFPCYPVNTWERELICRISLGWPCKILPFLSGLHSTSSEWKSTVVAGLCSSNPTLGATSWDQLSRWGLKNGCWETWAKFNIIQDTETFI